MKFTLGFRKVADDDIDFLLKLRKLSMNEHLVNAKMAMNDQQHLDRIKSHYYESQVILRDRKPIGVIQFGIVALTGTKKSLHIRQFQVLPEHQGRGVGSTVLTILKKRALQLQLPITLNVLLKNPARGLYLRHGFQIDKKNNIEFQMRCPLEVIAV